MSSHEHHIALREGHAAKAFEAYFEAHPALDTIAGRLTFRAGFDRGFDAAVNSLATQGAPAAKPTESASHPDAPILAIHKMEADRLASQPEGAEPLSDAQIDRIVEEQIGFDGLGTQPVNSTDLRRIARALLAHPSPHPEASPPAMPTDAELISLANSVARPDDFNWLSDPDAMVLRIARAAIARTPAMPESELRAAAQCTEALTDGEIMSIWARMPTHHSVVDFARAILARTTPQPEGADPTSAGRKS